MTADRPPVSGEPLPDLYEWTKSALLDAGFGISMTPFGLDEKVEALSRTIAEARATQPEASTGAALDAVIADAHRRCHGVTCMGRRDDNMVCGPHWREAILAAAKGPTDDR